MQHQIQVPLSKHIIILLHFVQRVSRV